MYSRNLFVLDFTRRFFVRCVQIFEAYAVRTLIKFERGWRKIGRKSKCRKDSESTYKTERKKAMYQIKENQIRLSVRSLVEFVLRSGSIDNRQNAKAQKDAMQAGSRLHRKIQRMMGSGYQAEVSLKHTVSIGDLELALEGRADGILTAGSGVRKRLRSMKSRWCHLTC